MCCVGRTANTGSCAAGTPQRWRRRAFADPIGVRLPGSNEADADLRDYFEPDPIVFCDPRKIEAAGIRGAPDFVIEVLSPSTAAYDLIDKRGV